VTQAKRPPEFDAEMVRNISEAVYRDDLGPADTASMIEKDGDSGKKLRERAGSYDKMTRAYMRAIKQYWHDALFGEALRP